MKDLHARKKPTLLEQPPPSTPAPMKPLMMLESDRKVMRTETNQPTEDEPPKHRTNQHLFMFGNTPIPLSKTSKRTIEDHVDDGKSNVIGVEAAERQEGEKGIDTMATDGAAAAAAAEFDREKQENEARIAAKVQKQEEASAELARKKEEDTRVAAALKQKQEAQAQAQAQLLLQKEEEKKLEQERLEQEQLKREQQRLVDKEKLQTLEQERLEQEQLKQEELKQEELKQEELKQEELKREQERLADKEKLKTLIQERLEQEQLKQEDLKQEELKREELKQEEKRLADKEKLKTLKQERLEQEKLKQEKQHKEAEEYQKQLPEQNSRKEVKTTTSTASTQTVLDQLSLVKFGANVAKEEPPEQSVDTKSEEKTLKTMATLMFASSVVIRHHSTNGSNSVVQETPSTIPMMLQAAIRWASTWTFDSTKHSQNNIHLDVHPSTNNPYSYEQWLAFVQRASRGYTIALNASQEQKDSCKKNGFQEEHATNKSTTTKRPTEHASLAMFGPLPTEPMDLSDYVSWFHCRMLRAEFDGLNKAMDCCCSGQQKVIMVVPSFATCALLSIASSWDTPLSNGAFEEMVEVSTKMKTATQNIEILVHRNSGLKDAVQARLMAERECKQLPTRRRRNEESLAVTDTRDLIRVSTQRLMQLVQRSQNTTLRTSYKCLCRCNANGPAELLAGAHHHPTSCISCMTSAFVRYAAACCSIYTMGDRHGTTTETASSNQSNRIQVTFGSEGRMMEEKFRLYTKEDVRCLFVVLGLNNPGDLHPVIVAYDLDVWWSIVYHYGSVSEGLRQIFEAGVAEAIILSFHFFE